MDGSGKIDLHKGVRSGAQYLAGLQDGREVWSGGERIDDVTTHPATRRGAATLGRFLDRQMDDDVRDTVTYVDEDGDRCAWPSWPHAVRMMSRRGGARTMSGRPGRMACLVGRQTIKMPH